MKDPYIYRDEEELVSAFLQLAEEEGIVYQDDKPAFREDFCIFVDAAERDGNCSSEVAAKAVLPDEYYR